MTATGNHTFPLRDASRLWIHPEFNIHLPMEFFVTGWTSNVNETNDALELVYKAYACRGGANFVVSKTDKSAVVRLRNT